MATPRRLVIIGGVAAGATAAARARRLSEDVEILLIERGKYVSFANCGLPYFLSGDIKRRSALLLQTPEGFFSRYRVEVRLETEAVKLDRDARRITLRKGGVDEQLSYDELLLAQGGSPFVPPIAGSDAEHVFRLWTMIDLDRIHRFVNEKKPRSAVVVGGGFIGLETSEALRARGLDVSLVELAPHPMPTADAEFGGRIVGVLRDAGIQVHVGRKVVELAQREGAPVAILDDGTVLPAEVVVLSAGVRPNTELAASAGLALGPAGGVLVDERMRTSDPHIFAAGDMIEFPHRISGKPARIPLAGPANRQGRIAATNALGGDMRYAGALGTSVLKVIDHTFAMTGLSLAAAKAAGLEARSVSIHKDHHAAYYPGASELSLSLIFEVPSGRLLGAQAIGREGVDKRIDVVATALAGKLSVHELAEIDLAYAPPYGSANDPLHMAAYAAQNALSGYSPAVGEDSVLAILNGGAGTLLDVRTFGERSRGFVSPSLHIPLDELRERLEEVPANAPVVVLSKTGFEGHVAVRTLLGQGRAAVSYLSGGMRSLAASSQAAPWLKTEE